MATGFAHILALGAVEDSSGLRVPQYQFTFNDGGNSYGRTFDEARFVEFLREDIGLLPDVLDRVLSDLREHGHSTITDLHLSGNDTAFMALGQVSSDY